MCQEIAVVLSRESDASPGTGQDTLHGRIYGWARRNWTILARTDTSVTYHHLDAADEGFPGDVEATVRSSPSLHLVLLVFTLMLTQTARGDMYR